VVTELMLVLGIFATKLGLVSALELEREAKPNSYPGTFFWLLPTR